MPLYVIVAAVFGDYAFVLGRTAIIFYAIRQGADTATVLLFGGAEGLVYSLTAGRLAGPLIGRLGPRTIIRAAAAALGFLFLTAPFITRPLLLAPLFAVIGFPLSLFWPSIHAALAERADPAALPRVQAYFNVAWSVAILVSFATGGWLFELGYALDRGPWVALASATAAALCITLVPLPEGRLHTAVAAVAAHEKQQTQSSNSLSLQGRRLFGLAGWLGNFGAFAVYDAVRLVFPSLAAELGFSEGSVGSLIALALLAQATTFAVTTRWRGWVYRPGWLYAACVFQLAALGLFFVAVRGWVFSVGFLLVGSALAATYAASLFYSLGATHTAGHAGGRHEAMIGAARVAGPLLGAGAARIADSSRAPFVMYAIVIVGLIAVYFMLFSKLGAGDRASIVAGR